ncbi:hypothetical protein ACTXT7_000286 [Hymenolepis weldensis]
MYLMILIYSVVRFLSSSSKLLNAKPIFPRLLTYPRVRDREYVLVNPSSVQELLFRFLTLGVPGLASEQFWNEDIATSGFTLTSTQFITYRIDLLRCVIDNPINALSTREI